MQAKVKQSHRWNTVVALTGLEFTKKEWRNVPVGREGEAALVESLELKDGFVETLAIDEGQYNDAPKKYPAGGAPANTEPALAPVVEDESPEESEADELSEPVVEDESPTRAKRQSRKNQ